MHRASVPDLMKANGMSALQMAVDAAKAASRAAAYAAATVLAQAIGTEGTIHLPEAHSGVWCRLTAGRLTADILSTSHGDRARMRLIQVTPEAYERVRTWVHDQEGCGHGEDCESCHAEPWPSYEELNAEDSDFAIVHPDDRDRGTAQAAFGRVSFTLDDEPVTKLAKIITLTLASD